MKKLHYLFVLILLFGAQISFSQYSGAKDGLAVRVVLPNYQYPITKDFLEDDFTSGMEIEYVRSLNSFLNLAIPFRINRADLPTNETGGIKNVPAMSLDALLQLKYFKPRQFFNPYLYAGISGMSENLDGVRLAVPVGGGFDFRIARHTYLTTKAEYRLGFEDLRDHLQLGAGILVLLGEGESDDKPAMTDRDGDGIPDAQDLCPDVKGLAAFNGCPDTDGDGLTDGEDQCPTVAGLKEFMGCPDGDGDGVPDKDDACPTEKGLASNKGCPVRDADGDGIDDKDDACPTEKGTRETKGCPDTDRDGIADREDECPTAPGPRQYKGCPDGDGDGVLDKDDRCPTVVGPASNKGCPEIKKEDKETLTFAMKAVQFETARATLKKESNAILDQIVDIMKRYPAHKLRINGHTDSIGEAPANQTLSEKRAKACYDYLVSKGIAANRMSHAGYGESQPIGDNRYKDGREKNRRVEFDLYIE
ncbi:MAG: OmpA family protein [Saprospiraceae bacterium]|nr:OmpA family protein [Saprospiraceae bacterium]